MSFMPDRDGLIEVRQTTDYFIVTLSYCISVLGARTALELLGKRTSHLGAMNWFRLLGAAFSMGFVGIWTTHFIGMKACIIDDGRPEAQLHYDPWYTLLSLIVPLVVLTFSFLSVGSQPQVNIKRILFGGSLAGFTVAFMHYCGQYAIKGYFIKYDLSYFIASIIVALIAVNAALYIFFRLRSKWKNQWYKKLGSALIMGIAVCGMHYTAYAGTHYFVSADTVVSSSDSISDGLLLGLNVTGSLITCTILITVVMISRNSELQRKRHAQKVVLGAAIYNEDGWILVSNDGFIPIKKITNEYSNSQNNLEDEFTSYHPVFQWIYRLSHDWKSVENWIPYIERHLLSKKKQTSRKIPYSVLFREMFALNANQLCESLNIPLLESGVLYDHILNTGIVTKQKIDCSSSIITSMSGKHPDKGSNINIVNNCKKYLKTIFYNNPTVNNIKLQQFNNGENKQVFGRGQMLFLVKQFKTNNNNNNNNNNVDVCNNNDTSISPLSPTFSSSPSSTIEESFHKLGYRFTDPRLIAHIMSEQLQVSSGEMLRFLEKMFIYSDSGLKCLLEPDQIYTGLFAFQRQPQGLQVMVMENSRHQIPMVKLSNITVPLNKLELDYIKRKNGMKLNDMLAQLGQTFFGGANSPTLTPADSDDNSSIRDSIISTGTTNTINRKRMDLDSLRYDLAQSLHQLIHLIGEENLYSDAILHSEVFTLPIPSSSQNKFAKLILFKLILPKEERYRLSRGEVTFIPYSLFKNYQDIIYYNSPVEMQNWKNRVNDEIGELLIKIDNSRNNDNGAGVNDTGSGNKFDFNNIEMVVEESQTIEEVTVNQFDINYDRINEPESLQPSITISTWNKEERWFESIVNSLDDGSEETI